MQYTIENEYLRLTVDTHGAGGCERCQQGYRGRNALVRGPCRLGRHAPILFPIPAS